ncbi:hypothetical protein [Saccharopolyspora shandongensis]|uniref:hypothetical protein n=1 Tax=Saccharopolyspora shandongensis TaxID=418495 RepID=UPI0033E0962C
MGHRRSDQADPARPLGQTGTGLEGATSIAFHSDGRTVAVGAVPVALWNIADRGTGFDNPASARLFLMLNTSSRLGVFPNAQQADNVVTEVNKWHPETLWVQVAKTLQDALSSLNPGQIDELLHLLSVTLRSTGHPVQADKLNDLRDQSTCAVNSPTASP